MEDPILDKTVKIIIEDIGLNSKSVEYSVAESDVRPNSTLHCVSIHCIETEIQEDSTENSFKVILKLPPTDKQAFEIRKPLWYFEKEVEIYRSLKSSFFKFQQECGVLEQDIFQPIPTCYSYSLDPESQYIATQDLRPLGYHVVAEEETLDMARISAIIKSLAKFHALSYAVYGGNRDKILEALPTLENRSHGKPEPYAPGRGKGVEIIIGAGIQYLRSKSYEKEAEKLLHLFKDFFEEMYHLTNLATPISVVVHGGYKRDNLLYNSNLDFKFVDFQYSFVGSRMLDLQFFCYTSLPLEFVDKNEKEICRIYYDEFHSFLTKFGLKTPNSDFVSLLNEFGSLRKYGIFNGLFMASAYLKNGKWIENMGERICNILRHHVTKLHVT